MPLPYSQDLRDRVLAACGRGMSTRQIAELFNVSPSWVRRVKQRLRDDGETSPRPPEPKCRHTKIDRGHLRELVELHPDATLVELRKMLGKDIVLAIVGNKADLEKRRTVSLEEAQKCATRWGILLRVFVFVFVFCCCLLFCSALSLPTSASVGTCADFSCSFFAIGPADTRHRSTGSAPPEWAPA